MKKDGMLHDKRIAVRTRNGVILFCLTSYTVSQGEQKGHGALHIQISAPNTSTPQPAIVFQAANGEFRICPPDQKAFRFKKDRYGAYNYLSKEKMQILDTKSIEHISALIINYQEILQRLQTRT